MSDALWADIERRAASHAYMAGVERTAARIAATGEVFTPTSLVIQMLRERPLDDFRPGATAIDPACGDGQFLIVVKWLKVLGHGMAEQAALADLYGVDLMRDNVDLCKRRLGGGTIIMGDTLNPTARLRGQSAAEHAAMIDLFT